jgi:hypothetical protein
MFARRRQSGDLEDQQFSVWPARTHAAPRWLARRTGREGAKTSEFSKNSEVCE